MIYETASQNIAEPLLYGAAFHIQRRREEKRKRGKIERLTLIS